MTIEIRNVSGELSKSRHERLVSQMLLASGLVSHDYSLDISGLFVMISIGMIKTVQ